MRGLERPSYTHSFLQVDGVYSDDWPLGNEIRRLRTYLERAREA